MEVGADKEMLRLNARVAGRASSRQGLMETGRWAELPTLHLVCSTSKARRIQTLGNLEQLHSELAIEMYGRYMMEE